MFLSLKMFSFCDQSKYLSKELPDNAGSSWPILGHMPAIIGLAFFIVAFDFQHGFIVELAVDLPLHLDLVVNAFNVQLFESIDQHVDLFSRGCPVKAIVHEGTE